MRFVIAVLVLLTMYLQYGLWYTRGGKQDVEKLQASVAEQKDEIARLKERNRSLAAEVMDLKQGLEAVEERARSEMGMVKSGEVFFRITDPNHEHDKPQSLAAGAANGAEQALEPPLDPLASGDAAMNDGVEVPPVTPQTSAPVKPLVAALAKAVAKKSEAASKAGAGVAAKASGTIARSEPAGKSAPSMATTTAAGNAKTASKVPATAVSKLPAVPAPAKTVTPLPTKPGAASKSTTATAGKAAATAPTANTSKPAVNAPKASSPSVNTPTASKPSTNTPGASAPLAAKAKAPGAPAATVKPKPYLGPTLSGPPAKAAQGSAPALRKTEPVE